MLLPEKKEREYRFRLALRIGLPIFGLILILIFTTLINNYQSLTPMFYIESAILLFVSIYFILYLIYKGFDVHITDPVSKAFTREYLYKYLKDEIKKHKNYTLLLVGIDNISDINTQYGIKNGDKVLYKTAQWIGKYIQEQGYNEFPLGRVKGGDFIVGLQGNMADHKVLIDLLCLKSEDFKVDDIELKISGAIIDTSLSKNLDHLVDALFELQENNRHKKEEYKQENIDPKELESLVIDAIERGSITLASQNVYTAQKEVAFCELFVRIKTKEEKLIHQKKYIKVINKLGLTRKFDTMLIEKIVANIDNFQAKRVAIGISTTSLRDIEFLNTVRTLFNNNATLHNRVVFILSENEYFTKIQRFNNIIKSYKEMGISIVVDRLGSVHTSFLYLRDLDVDIVRFDSWYTKGDKIFTCEATLKGLQTMAAFKGVQTWVKMIEDQKQYQQAIRLGIDLLEGKYLSQMQEEKI
jgi:EAL domain-containing protein (putative c-di-GMP-specific phosphodiesterase class I)